MTPVLWSFRRCPYAMRARLALAVSGQQTELREVVLRDKPALFLAASPSATVPCLVTGGEVIDESLDIMRWALGRHDPEGWFDMPDAGWDLIAENDGPFKAALDRTKYATRYPQHDPEAERAKAAAFLDRIDAQLDPWLFGRPSIADYAILPFVRQFAFIDKTRFDAEAGPGLCAWLARFLNSALFAGIMTKYPAWTDGDAPILFPSTGIPDATVA